MFMLVRLYAYKDDVRHDLGEYATVETRTVAGDLTVIGHPGSYVLLTELDEGWVTPEGRQFDRHETTTVRTGGDG